MTAKAPTSELVCNFCGAQRTTWGCRTVPLGQYCAQYGLQEDPARVRPGPVEDARISQNAEVAAASAVLASAEKREAEATARWQAAARTHWETRNRRWTGSTTVSVRGDLVDVRPPGTTDGDLRRLRELEAEADIARREAGEKTVQARQVLDETRTRVRRKLAHTR